MIPSLASIFCMEAMGRARMRWASLVFLGWIVFSASLLADTFTPVTPSTDVGTVALPGSTVLNAGVYTVQGSGADVWGSADAFQFAPESITGDVVLIARVTNLQNTSPWAKAGLMFRNTNDPGSPNSYLAVTPGHGLTFQTRWTQGGSTSEYNLPISTAQPIWLRLDRQGNYVTGSYSTDSVTWFQVGQASVLLGTTLEAGLAVTSHNATQLTTANLDNVSVSGHPPTDPPPGAPTGLKPSLITDSQIGLSWNVDPFAGSYLNVYRNGVLINTAQGVNFVDAGLTPGTSYTYTITNVDAYGSESAPSAPVTVQTLSATLPNPWQHMDLGLAPVTHYHGFDVYSPSLVLTDILGQATASPAANSFSVAGAGTGYNTLFSASGAQAQDEGLAVDEGQFLYQTVTGDVQLTVRLNSFSNVAGYSGIAGPMIRETNDSGARMAWGFVGQGIQGFQYRLNPNAASDTEKNSLLITYPQWMRIERVGSDFSYSISQDGVNWELIGEQTIAMNATVLVGFVANSGSATSLAQAEIDHVSIATPATSTLDSSGDTLNNLTVLSTAATENGAQGQAVLGNWVVNGTSLVDRDNRGSVQFQFNVNEPDIYELSLTGQPGYAFKSEELYNLRLYVDGAYLGLYTLTSVNGAPGTLNCLTPYLTPGAHTVLVYWDNNQIGRSFQINQVSLNRLGSAKGSEAWVQGYLNSTEFISNPIASSATSPYCLEGQSRYPSLVSLPGTGLTVQNGINNNWFVNLPLQTDGTTSYTVSFQNGGLVQNGKIQWSPTNVLSSPNLTIRAGDSLLLVVEPTIIATGSSQITIGTKATPSLASFQVPIGTPQPYAFTQAGTYTVTGSVPGSNLTNSIQVTVVGSSFNGSPVAWVGRQTIWNNPQLVLPPQVVLNADSRIVCQQQPLSPAGSQLSLLVDAPESRYVVARLGSGGPILGNAKIQGTNIASSIDTGIWVVEVYPDGSQLVQMMVVVDNLTPGMTVVIHIFAGGVTFADGTTTKTLTAADFNALGEAIVSFIYPAGANTSICHTLSVYNGSTLVGNR